MCAMTIDMNDMNMNMNTPWKVCMKLTVIGVLSRLSVESIFAEVLSQLQNQK